MRQRPLHDSPFVHARRRQPPTIGENRLLFCANGEQEEKKGAKAAESEEVKLYGILPPITKVCPSARSNNPAGRAINSATRGQMDNSLSTLKKCRHLSVSSHSIEKISNLSGLGARTDRPLSV